MVLVVGQTVGEYQVIDVIGSGGMGTVYKVKHLISDRIEAIKVILPSLTDSPELADRFMREIKVQARLSHPNITSLHNALRLDQQLLMVMEYVEGTSLYQTLRTSRMDLPAAIRAISQVLNALGYAHSQGVIHRDIKPANIMLTSEGHVKLMDFGIARSLAEQKDLTRTGAAIGSVYYMSPEQIKGGRVDGRSDLYSTGVTFYEMVTGTKPIIGDTSWAIMNAHVHEIPKPPHALDSNVPRPLSLAILKALEKNPADRYQSASEFLNALTPLNHVPAGKAPVPSVETVRQPAANGAPTFNEEDLSRLKSELATFVGPIARIIVDRAARKATSLRQLYDVLSEEIPEGADRKKFLASRKQFLATRPR